MYSISLKKQKFNIIYIDAFAGEGYVDLPSDDGFETIEGSARIALSVDSPFDEYIFIENDASKAMELQKLVEKHPNKKIEIRIEDCNSFIINLCKSEKIKYNMYLLFLDPFGTEVRWETLEALAKVGVFDIWYLFSLAAAHRLMPRKGQFIDWQEKKLMMLFGTSSWKENLYARQMSMLDNDSFERNRDVPKTIEFVHDRLEAIFQRVCDRPAILTNEKNAPMFALFFAMTNPNPAAQELGFKFANHILRKHESG